jgi:hypothetical protein
MKRQTGRARFCFGCAAVVIAFVAVGCSAPAQRATPTLPGNAAIREEPWAFDGRQGRNIVTEHYVIHTTIADRELLQSLATVMEGALLQYRQFTPDLRLSSRPMECYVFAQRNEWATFTREKTGADAAVYLQINRGGYTVRDWYVAYLISEIGTYAVAAHEGWHQYVARHFKSRLPPFLEEGIATMFETIAWDAAQRPRWNLGINPQRADKLRRAIEKHSLWPLEQLITMHAGDVVGLSGERIETFYAQDWAFAEFMWNAENGRYRASMLRMLSDLANGTTPESIGIRRALIDSWNPETARPLLEFYFGMSLDQIDHAYVAYVKRIAAGVRQSHGAV